MATTTTTTGSWRMAERTITWKTLFLSSKHSPVKMAGHSTSVSLRKRWRIKQRTKKTFTYHFAIITSIVNFFLFKGINYWTQHFPSSNQNICIHEKFWHFWLAWWSQANVLKLTTKKEYTVQSKEGQTGFKKVLFCLFLNLLDYSLGRQVITDIF